MAQRPFPLPDRAGAGAGRRCRRGGRWCRPTGWSRLVPRGARRRWCRVVTLALAVVDRRSSSRPATAATSWSPTTSGPSDLGHPLVARHRRHLALPGADDRAALPAHHARRPGAARPAVVRGLDPAARGGLPGQLRLARPGPVLPLLRADPGARRTSSSAGGATPGAGYAAIKFFVYTFAGSAFLLVGHPGGRLPPPVPDRRAHLRAAGPRCTPTSRAPRACCSSCAFTAAFAVKAPIFPFHTWSPDAYAEAPDRRCGAPGRGHGQARHLRDHPLRPQPLPPGQPDPGPAGC